MSTRHLTLVNRGGALFVRGTGIETCTLDRYEDGLILSLFIISPRLRNRGIGSAVIAFLKTLGKPIYLTAAPQDDHSKEAKERLRNFYRRHGFRGRKVMYWLPNSRR